MDSATTLNVAPKSDLTGVCFKDQIFLNMIGGLLSQEHVFEYFSNSPFYDRNSSNEHLRMQGIYPFDISQLQTAPQRFPSVEYTLDHIQEPHLFVIKKQIRESSEKATAICIFYILDGSVYQAPTLYGVLGSRMAKALHHVGTVFHEAKAKLDKSGKAKSKERKRRPPEEEVELRESMRLSQILTNVFSTLPPMSGEIEIEGPTNGDVFDVPTPSLQSAQVDTSVTQESVKKQKIV